MSISLPLLVLVLWACAGVARGTGFDPVRHLIRLADLDAGIIHTAVNNVDDVAGQAAGPLHFAEASWKT